MGIAAEARTMMIVTVIKTSRSVSPDSFTSPSRVPVRWSGLLMPSRPSTTVVLKTDHGRPRRFADKGEHGQHTAAAEWLAAGGPLQRDDYSAHRGVRFGCDRARAVPSQKLPFHCLPELQDLGIVGDCQGRFAERLDIGHK